MAFLRLLLACMILLLPAWSTRAQPQQAAAAGDIRWKAILVAGDLAQTAFHNAAHAMARMLATAGIPPGDIRVLSAWEKDPRLSSGEPSLQAAFRSLDIRPGDGCLVFMTSHGSQGGLRLRGANSYYSLSPAQLAQMLTAHCGAAPTMVITSGCYSGVFTGEVMTAPNRVIYTAARPDRPSFGCQAHHVFTVFDYCFLLGTVGGGSWDAIRERSAQCVTRREGRAKLRPSEPQFFVGAGMAGIRPPAMPPRAILALWQAVPPDLATANTPPFAGTAGHQGLSSYKAIAGAKALAVASNGAWSIGTSPDGEAQATAAAMADCRRRASQGCLVYARGNQLVWHDSVAELIRASPQRVAQVLY